MVTGACSPHDADLQAAAALLSTTLVALAIGVSSSLSMYARAGPRRRIVQQEISQGLITELDTFRIDDDDLNVAVGDPVHGQHSDADGSDTDN